VAYVAEAAAVQYTFAVSYRCSDLSLISSGYIGPIITQELSSSSILLLWHVGSVGHLSNFHISITCYTMPYYNYILLLIISCLQQYIGTTEISQDSTDSQIKTFTQNWLMLNIHH